MNKHNPRCIALRLLQKVLLQHQSLTPVLLADENEAIVQQYVYGVVRYWHRLDGLLKILMDKPLKAKEGDIAIILLIGCYELLYSHTADYAVISESVNLVEEIGKPWAKGLVNALLRRLQREKEKLTARLDEDVVTRYSHPQWLIDELQRAYASDWQTILNTSNTQAPMTLCVNSVMGTREEYISMLARQNIAATMSALSPDGITLKHPQVAASLPGFLQGWVNVQDEAAQYAAVMLDCQPRMRVLDACAAPGNKAAHIAARQPACDYLLAIDKDVERVESIKTLQQRLKFTADIRCADATMPGAWWDGKLFDRILLDAPCSATGVIRRHPDIKYHRRAEDILLLIKQQQALLIALWPLLKSGGQLLYVTCSLLPQENMEQIDKFIHEHESAKLIEHSQLIPIENSHDGLFFAKLQKR